jgi:hypothetical protein
MLVYRRGRSRKRRIIRSHDDQEHQLARELGANHRLSKCEKRLDAGLVESG